MQKLLVFNNVTLDGYFTGPNGDLSWAHQAEKDEEFDAFVASNASNGGTLVLGRITYDMMASYWPTPQAAATAPEVAKGMNEMQKVVFSRTLDRPAWQNTKVVKDDVVGTVRKLKQEAGKGLTILGSGSIVSQLAKEGLIDEYQLVVNPVVLGEGRTMFDGMNEKLPLELTKTRAFKKGRVFMSYEPKHEGSVNVRPDRKDDRSVGSA